MVSVALLNLVFYCLQQLGVMLGVGAETIILLGYLLAIRDGVVDDKEKLWAHAVRWVLRLGLVCIIVSGVGITLLHLFAGEEMVVATPAYLFKWALVAVVAFLTYAVSGSSLPFGLLEGLAGGTWYAIFVVHILAPVATWYELGVFYGAWLGGFCLCWCVLVLSLRGRPVQIRADERVVEAKTFVKQAVQKPAGPPPPIKPAVIINPDFIPPKSAPPTAIRPTVSVPPPAPLPPAPPDPAPIAMPAIQKPPELPGLPAIRVMPKTPADIKK